MINVPILDPKEKETPFSPEFGVDIITILTINFTKQNIPNYLNSQMILGDSNYLTKNGLFHYMLDLCTHKR